MATPAGSRRGGAVTNRSRGAWLSACTGARERLHVAGGTATGAQVMGSEGYLINQFIAKHTNKRTDEWCVGPGADVGSRGEPSPDADVAGVISFPCRCVQGRAQLRCV